MLIEDNVNKYKLNENDFKISVAICVLLFLFIYTNFINNIFNYFGFNGFIYDTFVCIVISVYFIFKGLKVVIKNLKLRHLIIYIIFLFIYLSTFFLFPKNTRYMFSSIGDIFYNPFYNLFIFSLPFFFFIQYIGDFKIFIKVFYNFSTIAILFILSSFYFFPASYNYSGNYMVLSYNLLIPVCFQIYIFSKSKNLINLILIILSISTIFLFGSRGTLVCIILYLMIVFLRNNLINTKKTIFFLSVFSMSFIIFVWNFNKVEEETIKTLINLNIESRTVSKIINSNFFEESGRNVIREVILNKIDDKILYGYGLYGDRVLTEQLYAFDTFGSYYSLSSTYSHNILLELMVNFGLIGFLIFIYILIKYLKTILNTSINLKNDLIVIFGISGLIKLLFSGSYLNEPYFYLMIGLISINANKYLRSK